MHNILLYLWVSLATVYRKCVHVRVTHWWAHLLKKQTSITVHRLLTKENKLPFSICRKQTEVVIFRFFRIYTRNGSVQVDILIGGHQHRSQYRRYPTSDIDICHPNIGDKYVGLKNVIPISTSEFNSISDIEDQKTIHLANSNPRPLQWKASALTLCYCDCSARLGCRIWDIG